jgi:hypothetical protein
MRVRMIGGAFAVEARSWNRALTGSPVSIVRSTNQEVTINQSVQDQDARRVVECPETLRLLARELKAWHLQVLAFDAVEQLLIRFTSHL